MSFESAIREQQKRQYRGDKHFWPAMTIGDLIGAVLSIHNEQQAREFYEGYKSWLNGQPGLDNSAEHVARANIGWCFGEGMSESDMAMWRKVGASHPIFGSMEKAPTATEAFEAGVKAAG